MNVERQALETRRSQLALAAEEGKKGAAAELEEVEEELRRRDRDEERKRLADQARADREREQRKEERADAIVKMREMTARFEAKFEEKLRAVKCKPDPQRKDVLPVYTAGRLVLGCANELCGITGDYRDRKIFSIQSKLGHLAELIPECFGSRNRKPVAEYPPEWIEQREIIKETA